MGKKEKTVAGKIFQELKPSFKKIIPMLIGIIAKNQKFNKTPADEKRIDDIVNNL